MDEAPAPLAGLRVLDLTRVLAGPLATMTLGDLGADVIKVERPREGDDTRHWGPPFAGDDAAYFLSLNRNKRSVAIDLKTPEGVASVRRLAADSDVFIENFRPGSLAEMGLGPADLRDANPRLITCSLTAFDQSTEATQSRPGYDIIVQALSGLMSVTGERDGEPTKARGGPPGRRDGPLRDRRDPGCIAGARTDRARSARLGVTVRRQCRRHGEPGGQLPDWRCDPAGDGEPAPEHRSVPGVPGHRSPVHPGCRERPAVPSDV